MSPQEKEAYFEADTSHYDEYIFVDDDANITDRNILGKIKAFILKYGIEMLFVDYIQLVEVVKNGNTTEVSLIERLTSNLQRLAKEADIAIVALAQLVRSSDVPTAKSLRGGGLEQAASDILILYDEHWKENDGVKWTDIPENRRGLIKCIYAKGRYTEVGNRDLYFDKPRQTFSDWSMAGSMDEMREVTGFSAF